MLKDLLESGLFPSQLPPCFDSASFAKYCVAKGTNVPQVPKPHKQNTSAEKFSVARAGHYRRPTVIVNPHAYFHLAREIATNWELIDTFLKKSTLSKSRPQATPGGGRSITITPTRELAELRLLLASGFKYVLITDIAQFFPSVYTHAISWALYSKHLVKLALAGSPGAECPPLGDNLDRLMRALQSNQTIGIPIGPDASHIFAEIIATAADIALQKQVAPIGFRYVDDYVFFFNAISEAEECLAELSKQLAECELTLNAAKTRIVPISGISSDFWTHELKSFRISNKQQRQRRDIQHFFDVAFFLAERNTDENVMKFALKKISANLIFPDNWPLVEAHLLRAAISYPNTMIDVARVIFTYNAHGYEIGTVAVKRTIHTIIDDHCSVGHHSEVAWALWIAGVLGISIDAQTAELVYSMKSSPCLLLMMHLHRIGLCDSTSNKLLKERSSVSDLYGDMWLAVYESRVQKFYEPTIDVLLGTFFGKLRDEGVKFFNFSRVPKPLFNVLRSKTIANLFAADGSYDEGDVEFAEVPDEYADEYEDEADENPEAPESIETVETKEGVDPDLADLL